jgi:hypothetical protein
MNKQIIIFSMLLLSGCASGSVMPPPRPQAKIERPSPVVPPRPAFEKRGLESVMGKDSAALTRLFGTPRLDVVEVYGRKLQFVGKACVLDAYLYPEGSNKTEIVTYIDARRSDGAEVDRAACVDALQRR